MTTDGQSNSYDREREAFIRYLEEASTTVESWPEWKRTILGGTTRANGSVTASSGQNAVDRSVPSKPVK